MHSDFVFRPRLAAVAVIAALFLVACGGGSSNNDNSASVTVSATAEPAGLGYTDTADAPSGVLAYVDNGATNVRGDACHATVDTNAGVRVLKGYLDIWTPSTLLVDAGQSATTSGTCAGFSASTWTGIPMDSTDGTVANYLIHKANIGYVASLTASRTTDQELAAYLDDRRNKSYSVTDGMGPLTAAWRTGTGITTTITATTPPASTDALASDGGIDVGTSTSAGNTNLGLAVDFINAASSSAASTEPTKRFFKSERPFRWSSAVVVAPSLVKAESSTPATDGAFPSGHAAEAWRRALAMAYLVPQRYQEMLTRAMELGQNRIMAGMHSPLDVMGGRVLATAIVAYNLNNLSDATLKSKAVTQTQSYLQTQAGVGSFAALNTYAHSAATSSDRFADYTTNKSNFLTRMTYGFPTITSTTTAAVVPKGAEILLETRLPYLTAAQRRVVLKTTEIGAGYPLTDEDEGWARLNLFAAADGYGAFNGDVSVTMDATQGGFNAEDSWKNNISGAGKLTKLGTGELHLTGANTYSGGTSVQAGILAADSTTAFGTGTVYVANGTLLSEVLGTLTIKGNYTQLNAGTLQVAMNASNQGVLSVAGQATLAGTLHVSFPGSYTPAVGDTITVLNAGSVSGTFSTITVDGFSQVTPIYTSTGVQLKIVAK